MCGRFGLSRVERLGLRQFGVGELPELTPRFNIPPGSDILTVRLRKAERVADFVRWGLIPSWAKDPSIGGRMANARADTAFGKSAFREAMKVRRCLIPADVFYEWQAIRGQTRKQPHAVRLKDSEVFALGGIWEYWRPPGDQAKGVVSCAILTTDANTLMTPIHDRMPVIVPPESYAAWLDPRTPDPAVNDLIKPFPSTEMEAWPISLRVNSPKDDDEGILEPVDPAPA